MKVAKTKCYMYRKNKDSKSKLILDLFALSTSVKKVFLKKT